MDDINGQELQIALVIKEGRGFGGVQHPLYIEASLAGNYLDTNTVKPCEEPQFFEELTWLLDKKRLKRLRTSASHIRVNCYSLIATHERENIGFLMLSLKSAQIQTDKHPEVSAAWYKLIGTRSPRPEVLLSYSIRSATVLPQRIAPFVTAPTEQAALQCRGDNVDITPQLFSEQGMIQIGPAIIGTDVFLLNIVVGEASHLHLILPENMAREDDKRNTFHFRYTVCAHVISTKYFDLDSSSDVIVPASEKITIRIRSSLPVLKTYFNRQSVVPFQLMSGDEEVASTSVDLKTLVPTESLEEFCSRHMTTSDGVVQKSQCLFTSAKTQQVPVGEDGSKPSVNVVLMFKFVERQVVPITGLGTDVSRTYTLLKDHRSIDTAKEVNMLQELCTNSFSAPEFVTNPESNKHSESSHTEQSEAKQSCVSDQPVLDNVPRETAYLLPQHNGMSQVERAHKKNLSESKSQETVLSHAGCGDVNQQQPLEHLVRSTAADKGDALHRYDLTIVVESVHFQRVFSEEKVFFKFYHPNAEVVCGRDTEVLVHRVGEDIPLHSVSYKLGIHSTPNQIGHLLLVSPPRISICCRATDEETRVLAATALDSAPLLSTDKRECCYSKILWNISTGQEVATAKLSLVLEDVGAQNMMGDHNRRKLAEYYLGTAVENELAANRVVEEMEEWKQRQQEIFKEELLGKEKAHLALLTDDWNKKKAEIEATLRNENDKCCKMAEDLQRIQEDLNCRRQKSFEREKEVQLMKEALQAEWTEKLRELEELRTKMNLKVDKTCADVLVGRVQESQWDLERADLEQSVTSLRQEVGLWEETVRIREAQLEEMKKSLLTTEQVTQLCQELKMTEEKLQAALKVKSFYKEQWARAVKEILHIKTQNRDALQISIRKNERNQLKNIGIVKSVQDHESMKTLSQKVLYDVKVSPEKSDQNFLNNVKESTKKCYQRIVNDIKESSKKCDQKILNESKDATNKCAPKLMSDFKQYVQTCGLKILNNAKEKVNDLAVNHSDHHELDSYSTEWVEGESSTTLSSPGSSDDQSAADKTTQSKRELEKQLQSLTKKRDTLLRNGNYHVNDVVIKQLNQEICVVLAELKN